MRANLRDLLPPARAGGYAVGCFNVFGYEDARAVVDAAEARGTGVILAVNLDMLDFMSLDSIVGLFNPLAEAAAVPVCLHLDHNYEIDTVLAAVDAGFTSVMYDGSQLPLDDNVAGVRRVVDYARPRGVSVEAEVGSVPYASGRDHIKSELTAIDDAIAMAERGDPDALAVSVGNVHRLQTQAAEIDFTRFDALLECVDLPLVIHGTSGIREADLVRLARGGVCKFNIGTTVRRSFGDALRETLAADPELFDRLTIMRRVMPAVTAEAGRMIDLLRPDAAVRS